MTEKHKDISLRNIEYYGMFETFDKLYIQSQNNVVFDDLMSLITSDTNINLLIEISRTIMVVSLVE